MLLTPCVFCNNHSFHVWKSAVKLCVACNCSRLWSLFATLQRLTCLFCAYCSVWLRGWRCAAVDSIGHGCSCWRHVFHCQRHGQVSTMASSHVHMMRWTPACCGLMQVAANVPARPGRVRHRKWADPGRHNDSVRHPMFPLLVLITPFLVHYACVLCDAAK